MIRQDRQSAWDMATHEIYWPCHHDHQKLMLILWHSSTCQGSFHRNGQNFQTCKLQNILLSGNLTVEDLSLQRVSKSLSFQLYCLPWECSVDIHPQPKHHKAVSEERRLRARTHISPVTRASVFIMAFCADLIVPILSSLTNASCKISRDPLLDVRMDRMLCFKYFSLPFHLSGLGKGWVLLMKIIVINSYPYRATWYDLNNSLAILIV